MPRPENAKVWNEDLVTALRARQEQCRQQGSQRQFLWRDGAIAMEKVRQDIYTFRTGRIVGLPTNLKKTVEELCRSIIAGQAPIYPPGFVPVNETTAAATSVDSRNHHNNYLDDPYLQRMKADGGAAAILLAFYVTGKEVLTKAEICRVGQQFCSEQMESNFLQGRAHGAWSSNKTLANHGLITVNKTTAYNPQAGGFRAQGQFTYTLTREGQRFTEALLQTRPALREQVNRVMGPSTRTTVVTPLSKANRRNDLVGDFMLAATASNPLAWPKSHFQSAPSDKALEDEKELREWAQTARRGQQKMFQVSKARRKYFHDVCDQLNLELHPSGKMLRHESQGTDARVRALYVTVIESSMSLLSQIPMPPLLPDMSSSHVVSSPIKRSPPRMVDHDIFSGVGQVLSPTKRSRPIPPSVAAAEAALMRQALHESKMGSRSKRKRSKAAASSSSSSKITGSAIKPLTIDFYDLSNNEPEGKTIGITCDPRKTDIINVPDDSDSECSAEDRKLPASSRVKADDERQKKISSSVVNLYDSDSLDDDIMDAQGLTVPAVAGSLFEDASSRASTYISSFIQKDLQLKIFIDSRERNRNNTPRTMRMELTRMTESGVISLIWPKAMPCPIVEEQHLPVGDFAFDVKRGEEEYMRFPCMIERKRVSDLVQRSGRRDHWKQLLRMNDAAISGDAVFFFVIEGDFRTAGQFTAFGTQHLEDLTRNCHTIDDDMSLVRFIGRAILSCQRVRFIQTSHELGSLRAVAAVCLMASVAKQIDKPFAVPHLSMQAEQRKLVDRLTSGGIPRLFAEAIGTEIGSQAEMTRRYDQLEEEYLRDNMLEQILADVCDSGSRSTASSWSRACHKVFFSALSDPESGGESFAQGRDIVEDEACLLGHIHEGKTLEEAIDATLTEQSTPMVQDKRKLYITAPTGLETLIPLPTGDDAFYDLKVVTSKSSSIHMQTRQGALRSSTVVITVLEGSELVDLVQKSLLENASDDFVQCAQSIARVLKRNCDTTDINDNPVQIFLIRGLSATLEVVSKQANFLPQLRPLVDLVLAELMVVHHIVVLQAVRKSNDCDMILQQMALACYYYQTLTR